LANVSAVQLGATAIKKALENAGVGADKVEEVLMGNVVGAGVGQAPARQAALAAGIPETAVCTTINKVCASGMKTMEFAALSLAAGMSQVAVAGGMESMSNVPFYVRRGSVSFGNQTMEDGILKDGLWDVYNDVHMGMCAEETAEKVRS
jgi:acetyl-CoA C-acetyltransferase